MTAKGLIVLPSGYGPEETMNRFEDEVRAKGMTVFAHVDYTAIATAVGSSLDPTDLLIFGDARIATALMQQRQIIGIDLPLKVLVWRDPLGATWLSYCDLAWVAKRHGLGRGARAELADLGRIVTAIAEAATGNPRPAS
jgi:uncharacterized protein (DUF302 family)